MSQRDALLTEFLLAREARIFVRYAPENRKNSRKGLEHRRKAFRSVAQEWSDSGSAKSPVLTQAKGLR